MGAPPRRRPRRRPAPPACPSAKVARQGAHLRQRWPQTDTLTPRIAGSGTRRTFGRVTGSRVSLSGSVTVICSYRDCGLLGVHSSYYNTRRASLGEVGIRCPAR